MSNRKNTKTLLFIFILYLFLPVLVLCYFPINFAPGVGAVDTAWWNFLALHRASLFFFVFILFSMMGSSGGDFFVLYYWCCDWQKERARCTRRWLVMNERTNIVRCRPANRSGHTEDWGRSSHDEGWTSTSSSQPQQQQSLLCAARLCSFSLSLFSLTSLLSLSCFFNQPKLQASFPSPSAILPSLSRNFSLAFLYPAFQPPDAFTPTPIGLSLSNLSFGDSMVRIVWRRWSSLSGP